MSNIAIITARGGSKRIPRKNIKNFCGQPIIAYSIKAALESGIFDEVMVSTDDDEIANIAKAYGAKVPFLRGEVTSNDYATTSEVIKEVLDEYKKKGIEFDYFCCIYPTAPFVNAYKLETAMEMLINSKADSLLPVVKFSSPPQRSVVLVNDRVKMKWPENMRVRSQDLEPFYHDCGQFYCMKTSAFNQNDRLIAESTIPYIMAETEVQDIDTEEDWKLAEMKYKILEGMRSE